MSSFSRLALAMICLSVMFGNLFVSPLVQAQPAPFVTYLPSVSKPIASANIEVVNTFGGMFTALAVAGDFAYVGEGAGLSVLDVSDPAQPKAVGRLPIPNSSAISAIDLEGTLAYLATQENGLVIVDISIPTTPKLLSTFTTDTPVSNVDAVGSTAYLATGAGGVLALNVSNPSAPTLRTRFPTTSPLTNVRFANDIVYATTDGGELLLLNATSLQLVGKLTAPALTRYVNVVVNGTTAYAVYSTFNTDTLAAITPQLAPGPGPGIYGLQSINVANPAAPSVLGSYQVENFSTPEPLVFSGSRVYIGGLNSDLDIIDVQNPSAPTRLYRLNRDSGVGLQISGDRIYSASSSAVTIADKTAIDNGNIVSLGTYIYTQSWQLGPMQVVNNRLYSFNTVYDISVPTQPTLLRPGPVTVPRYPGFDNDFAVVSDTIYSVTSTFPSSSEGALTITDFSDPMTPVFQSSITSVGAVFGVEVVGQLAYLVGSRGLQVVDVSNLRQPVVLANGSDTANPGRGLAIVGNRAYVVNANGPQGLQVFDISTPTAPKLITTVSLSGTSQTPLDIRIANGYAYIRGTHLGVQILDLSNPDAPALVNNIEAGVPVLAAEVRGTLVYLTTSQGLRVYDVQAPAAPRLVTSYNTSGETYGIAFVGDLIYLADSFGGFQIIRLVVE